MDTVCDEGMNDEVKKWIDKSAVDDGFPYKYVSIHSFLFHAKGLKRFLCDGDAPDLNVLTFAVGSAFLFEPPFYRYKVIGGQVRA